VVAYGQILSKKVLDMPRLFCVNAHASLLPVYRGAAPISWALINGEKNTGVSIIQMAEKMDAGPLIMQKAVKIKEQDNSITLEEYLGALSAQLLLQSIGLIEKGKYKLTFQDESDASFAPKLKKEDGLIRWEMPAQDIRNLIRGCFGWPGAFTYYRGKLLKIYKSRVIPATDFPVTFTAGKISYIPHEGLVVACGKGCLLVEEVQPEGKRRMSIQEFVSGHKISDGDCLGAKK